MSGYIFCICFFLRLFCIHLKGCMVMPMKTNQRSQKNANEIKKTMDYGYQYMKKLKQKNVSNMFVLLIHPFDPLFCTWSEREKLVSVITAAKHEI